MLYLSIKAENQTSGFSTGCLRALFTYQSFSDFLLVSWNLGLIRISIQYFLYLLKISFQGSIGKKFSSIFDIFYLWYFLWWLVQCFYIHKSIYIFLFDVRSKFTLFYPYSQELNYYFHIFRFFPDFKGLSYMVFSHLC